MWTTAQRAEEALYVRAELVAEAKPLGDAAFALLVLTAAVGTALLSYAAMAGLGI